MFFYCTAYCELEDCLVEGWFVNELHVGIELVGSAGPQHHAVPGPALQSGVVVQPPDTRNN